MNYFRKILLLALAVVLALSFGTASFASGQERDEEGKSEFEFKDVQDNQWAFPYILKMQSKNVFSGYNDGTFKPNNTITRIEAIVAAVKLMGLQEEAKAAENVALHFKDTKEIEQKYPWAKGFVVLALQNGLFDASEEMIQPGKPATRIWVSTLMVRALDLQAEALQKMTVVPDFKDAKSIPAGAIGYVNVALEQGIISGYPDQTFKPQKNVTRAEMAALLSRTNETILEESGAITLQGTVEKIAFGLETVNEEVYGTARGVITIKTLSGDILSYAIKPDLRVMYHNRLIRAESIGAGDFISVTVRDLEVVEALILEPEAVGIENPTDPSQLNEDMIKEFELKLKIAEDVELKLEYQNENGEVKAEIEKKNADDKEKLEGEAAVQEINYLLDKLSLTPGMGKEEVLAIIQTTLGITEFKELEVEVKFTNGKKLEVEAESKKDKHDEEEEEDD